MNSPDVRAPAQRQRRELESGDPSLGALLEGDDLLRGERETHHVVEVCLGLIGSEAKVRGANLDQLSAYPPPRQGQVRVGSRTDDDVDVRGEVVQEEGDGPVDVAVVDEVVVVQDQPRLDGRLRELVDQHGQQVVDGQRGGPGQLQSSRPVVEHGDVEGGGHASPERRRVVVRPVEREPGHRSVRVGVRPEPLGEERRLAEPGGRGQQRQPRPRSGSEPLQKPGAAHQTGLPPRHVQLGGDQRTRHDPRPPRSSRMIARDGSGRLTQRKPASSNTFSRPTKSSPRRGSAVDRGQPSTAVAP